LADAVAVLPLDEGRGPTIADSSGNGRQGNVVGNPEWIEGKFGTALRFDGSADSAVLDRPVVVDGTDFAIGCWVKPGTSQKPWANLLSSHNNDTGPKNFRGISLEQDGHNTNSFYLIGGDGEKWVGTHVTTQLQAEEWQHFAVVRRGRELTHYLNGQVSTQGDVPDSPFAPSTDNFRLANWVRGEGDEDNDMLRFVERYQRLMAFELPKQYKVVYARSIDIADYYRRHFDVTPRTVFVSKTDHVMYDMWWLCMWCNRAVLVPRERIPWFTRIPTIMDERRTQLYFKDPLSYEYILVEDQRRSIRFERESPNPIWWFDYTTQERGPDGSAISHTETPDCDVLRSPWVRDGRTLSTTLTMDTQAQFADYAIALWDLPDDFDPDGPIETNAREHILAKNTEGEHHLVLVFDLKPRVEVSVGLRRR